MRDVDMLIDEALDAEERELLRSIGEEQGFMTEMFGIFHGRTGWVRRATLGDLPARRHEPSSRSPLRMHHATPPRPDRNRRGGE